MGKKTETKLEMHVEKQSVILANRIQETQAQLQALDGELVAIDQQHASLAGAVEIDPGAVQSLQTRRQMILAEQTTLQLRVGSLKEQQKAAERTEGIERIAQIEAEILQLTGAADGSSQECKEILHDLMTAVEALRKTLRTRNELSAEASFWAVACGVERPHLPPLVAIVDRGLLMPVTSALEGLNTSTAASSAWWQKIKVLKEARAVEAQKHDQQTRPIVETRQASPVPERVEKSHVMDNWIHGHAPQGFPVRL